MLGLVKVTTHIYVYIYIYIYDQSSIMMIHYILGTNEGRSLAFCIGIEINSKVHRKPYVFREENIEIYLVELLHAGLLGEMGGPDLHHTIGVRLA
jgi:hypothetical protein